MAKQTTFKENEYFAENFKDLTLGRWKQIIIQYC